MNDMNVNDTTLYYIVKDVQLRAFPQRNVR